jgi:hypothetical protein
MKASENTRMTVFNSAQSSILVVLQEVANERDLQRLAGAVALQDLLLRALTCGRVHAAPLRRLLRRHRRGRRL